MEDKYQWTSHARYKLRHYALSENRVKRIIRFPGRVEEGVIPNGIAVMQVGSGKRREEIWVMYVIAKSKVIRIITVWRYPGKSPERDPIPREVMEEAMKIVNF